MSYTVAQRTHDIGMRMALGAHSSNVGLMILVLGTAGSLALLGEPHRPVMLTEWYAWLLAVALAGKLPAGPARWKFRPTYLVGLRVGTSSSSPVPVTAGTNRLFTTASGDVTLAHQVGNSP